MMSLLKTYLLVKRSSEDDFDLLQEINRMHTPNLESEYIEQFRPILTNFTPYQRFALSLLSKESLET